MVIPPVSKSHLHLRENSSTVVGDYHLSIPVLDHFVHAARTEACSYRVRYCLRGDDVGNAYILRTNDGREEAASQGSGERMDESLLRVGQEKVENEQTLNIYVCY